MRKMRYGKNCKIAVMAVILSLILEAVMGISIFAKEKEEGQGRITMKGGRELIREGGGTM